MLWRRRGVATRAGGEWRRTVADETRIVVRPNGPYLVEGPLTVVDIEGREYRSDRPRIALCRCGNSASISIFAINRAPP